MIKENKNSNLVKINNDSDIDTLKSDKTQTESTSFVEVFCRLKPNYGSENDSCIKVVSDQSITLFTPPSKIVNGIRQEITCSFKKVFRVEQTQKEVFEDVALDLVQDAIDGKNGLLFTYGITGSGKTYTFGGPSKDPGILPRCITTLYNAVKDNLCQQGSIRLDKNGQVEIIGDLRLNSIANFKEHVIDKNSDVVCETPACLRRNINHIVVQGNQNMYGIFISMVEIYNNNIFDLFDEQFDNAFNKIPNSKTLRENTSRGIFILGLTYVPVSSVSEALTFYRKGKKRRKVAQTALNTESSRSHCVFTLHLVQIPNTVDGVGRRLGLVSQISLCDLAGSERMSRTQNEGDRQKESSSINSSLMTLRSCIEALRENQKHFSESGTFNSKLIPYRDNKLTLMFRNYFEGQGKVKMVLCLNSIVDDFEENLHVVKFSEITQEVKVKTSKKPKFKELKRCVEQISTTANTFESMPEAYSEQSLSLRSFPQILLASYDDGTTIPALISYLQERDIIRSNLKAELSRLGEEVVREVSELENKYSEFNDNGSRYKQKLEELERENSQLRNSFKVSKAALEEECKKAMNDFKTVRSELEEMKKRFIRERTQKLAYKEKVKECQENEGARLERECNKRVKEATEEMKNKLQLQDQRLKVVKGVLQNSSNLPPIISSKQNHKDSLSMLSYKKRKSSGSDWDGNGKVPKL